MKTLNFFVSYWSYWFYTSVQRFYAWFYIGFIGFTRLPAKCKPGW